MTDRDLVNRIVERDQSALKALYETFYPRLTRFVLRVTRDPELTLEVINDTFMVVWNSAARFRGDASVSTWVTGIAYRKALKALKRRPRWLPLEDDVGAGEQNAFERKREVERGLGTLSPTHRAVVELTYYSGYSYKEIGDILGCPENTVKTRMFHARKKLREVMEH